MPDINMPKLSDTMEEGTIVEWKKKSGDQVKAGEVLAEVESDKATFDLEAESDGVLQILVEQGVPAKIGAPIAKIGEAGAQAKSSRPLPRRAARRSRSRRNRKPLPRWPRSVSPRRSRRRHPNPRLKDRPPRARRVRTASSRAQR
ncbi:MAG: biotin/lipoyl-binding protein [Chloroflexi bacterium]|nr:MAG: biotin/lipoyl-binding protein [Chloroflexota bacterium]